MIDRLIRSVRFNYLKLSEILSVASSDKKLFRTSIAFQNSVSDEIRRKKENSRRLKDPFPVYPPRLYYKHDPSQAE